MVKLILLVVLLSVSALRAATVPQMTDDEKPLRCADQLPTDDESPLHKLTRLKRELAVEISHQRDLDHRVAIIAARNEELRAKFEKLKAKSKRALEATESKFGRG